MKFKKRNQRPAQPVRHAKRAGSSEDLVTASGEFNASSIQDLIHTLGEVAERVQAGDLTVSEQEETASAQERNAALEVAYNDPNSWAELGASISSTVQDRMTRQGFMRNLLSRGSIAQGGIPRVRARQKNVNAVTAVGPVRVDVQYVRDNYLYPTEFNIVANPRVSSVDIYQGSGDLLAEKFLDAQESIMVKEDRTWKAAADATVGVVHDVQFFIGDLTPTIASSVINQIEQRNIAPGSLVIASDFLHNIRSGSAWTDYLNPVSNLELIQTGNLGTIFGVDVTTDGFRDERLRVLEQGELYCTSTAEYHGAYTDRGPIESTPRDFHENVPAKGWYMQETISMAISNAKSVAKAQRRV